MGYDREANLEGIDLNSIPDEQLQEHLNYYTRHLENVKRAQRLVDSVGENTKNVLERTKERERVASKLPPPQVGSPPSAAEGSENVDENSDKNDSDSYGEEAKITDETMWKEEAEAPEEVPTEAPTGIPDAPNPPQLQVQQTPRPLGRSVWISQFNPNGPISIGSEVAFKPKKGGESEWFQCVVVKVSADGLRFEIRDPEPDELGNPGKTFKCNWRDIIFIPPEDLSPKSQTPNYPPGTKVLARYPETTTFYPAAVIGTKRDGTCRLKFDGEEEVDKETEVLRRLVLPYPTVSSTMAKK